MSRERGFTLLETLVALTILAMVLLTATGMVLYHPRTVRRLDAERQAYRALEATLEAVRAGGLPLESGVVPAYTPPGSPARRLTVRMTVTPEPQPGLSRVVLEAEYSVLNQRVRRKIESMVWEEPWP